jgi:hypothetical protein
LEGGLESPLKNNLSLSGGCSLKYDFVVHDGGDVSKIKLKYDGATALAIKNGALIAATPFGSITEDTPYTYEAETKQKIASSFVLKQNNVSFNVCKHNRDIIIDPSIAWATYYGGSGADFSFAICSDTLNGFVYITGSTSSTNNIVTSSAYQASFAGANNNSALAMRGDAYIAKFNTVGVRQWATYYGGADNDPGCEIICDKSGNILLAGLTGSTSGIATIGAHQTSLGGSIDCFLAKFSPSGNLVWGTYYGGSLTESISGNTFFNNSGIGLAVDNSNNIYLAGGTNSTNNIATPGAYQTTLNQNANSAADGFIVKFNANGIRQWGTYYGGSSTDWFSDISVDNSGNVYATGNTRSDTGIATIGTYQTTHSPHTIALLNNDMDGFLVKFNTSGQRQWGTYYGDNLTDESYSCITDGSGNAYITGLTRSTNHIATPGSSQPTNLSIGESGFLAKFNTSGQLSWGTYMGSGYGSVAGVEMTWNATGNICVLVYSQDSTNIPTSCALPTISARDYLGVCVFDSSGAKLWGTLFGMGTIGDGGPSGICSDKTNALYCSGFTRLSNLATPNAHQTTNGGGNGDGFLIKFDLDTGLYINHPFLDTVLCVGDTLKVLYGTIFPFNGGNSFIVQLSDSSGNFSSPIILNSVTTTIGGIINCIIPSGITGGGHYKIRIVATNPSRISCDIGAYIGIGTNYPSKPVSTNSGPVCPNDSLYLTASSSTGARYLWTGPNNFISTVQNPKLQVTTTSAGNYIVKASFYGCTTKDTTIVTVLTPPSKPSLTSNGPVCPGDTIKLTASSTSTGASYSWTGPNNFASSNQNPAIPNAPTNGSGYYVSAVGWATNACTTKDSINVTVKPLPAKPVIVTNAPICVGDSLQLNSSTTTSGVSYKWSGPNSFTSSSNDTGIGNAVVAQSGDYIIAVTLNGCSSKDTEAILINPYPQNVTAGSNTPVCPGTTLSLTGSSSTSGVAWSWTGPGSYSATTQNSSRTNMQTGWAGTYTVTAMLNGCPVSANANVASYITTPTPVVSANNPVCYGGTLNLTASNIAGAIYSWFGPNNYHSNAQNAIRLNMGAADAGVYIVNANVNGCISQTAVTQPITLISGPSVSAYASPSSTVCTGAPVALVAVPTNIGTNPATYNWYKNGNNTGGTGTSYITPSPANGDVFYVMMTAGTACNTPISSNNITITTLPATPPPAATIATAPGTNVWQGLNVTFSISSLANGGTTPGYQWKLNGTNVAAATKNTWSTTELKDGDSVCLWVTSSDQCATPKSTLSNCLGMKVPTNVTSPLQGDLGVYPNPVTKQLTIEGASVGTAVQVNNIIGQTVYRGVIQSSKENINTSQWAPGGYLLHLTDKEGNRVVRKVVKE